MQTPAEIVFDGVDSSSAVETRVRERIARLERFHSGITSCHVAIRAPHRHSRKGRRFAVRIEVRVPGTELVVSRKPGNVEAHEDVFVAVRDAFDTMERDLKRWSTTHRGEVKTAAPRTTGRIVELSAGERFGQIALNDGRLVYFHANSVVDPSFEELAVADPVEVVVKSGESPIGPQASTVKRIGALDFVAER